VDLISQPCCTIPGSVSRCSRFKSYLKTWNHSLNGTMTTNAFFHNQAEPRRDSQLSCRHSVGWGTRNGSWQRRGRR
jgi:hypothetical protein